MPITPGQTVGHIAVSSSQIYELFLDGSFARGFEVSVDGRSFGTVKNELSGFSAYALSRTCTWPQAFTRSCSPIPTPTCRRAAAPDEFTSLSAIALAADLPARPDARSRAPAGYEPVRAGARLD